MQDEPYKIMVNPTYKSPLWFSCRIGNCPLENMLDICKFANIKSSKVLKDFEVVHMVSFFKRYKHNGLGLARY